MDNVMLIAAIDARTAAEEFTDVKDRLRAAMKETCDHWCCTDENKRMLAAISVVIDMSEGEDRVRLEREMKMLAALSRGTLNLDDMMGDPYEPVGILAIWREVTGRE